MGALIELQDANAIKWIQMAPWVDDSPIDFSKQSLLGDADGSSMLH
jgi:hypothetical protein